MAGPFDSILGAPAQPMQAPTNAYGAPQAEAGIFDGLFGPPAALRAQREQQSFTQAQEGNATARAAAVSANQNAALQELARMQKASPNTPPNALLTQFLTSPTASELLVKEGIGQEFLGKAIGQLTTPMLEVGDGNIVGRLDDQGNFNEVTRGMPKTPLVNIDRIGEDAKKDWNKAATDRYGEIEKQQIAARTLATVADRIDDQLIEANGRDVVGMVGKVAGALDVVASQSQAAAREMGLDIDPQSYPEFFGKDSSFKALSNQQAAVQSNITGLAFAIARANNKGGPVTKPDFEKALDQIGGSWTTPDRIRSALNELVNNAVDDADGNLQMSAPRFTGSDIQPMAPLRQQLQQQGIGQRWQRKPIGVDAPQAPTGPRGVKKDSKAPAQSADDVTIDNINALSDDELFVTKKDGSIKSVVNPKMLKTDAAKQAFLARMKAYKTKSMQPKQPVETPKE